MIRALAFAVFLNLSFQASAEDVKPVKDAGPYVPSPQSVVSDMLRHAMNRDSPPSCVARRRFAKARTKSSKNMTPKRETIMSKLAGSKA